MPPTIDIDVIQSYIDRKLYMLLSLEQVEAFFLGQTVTAEVEDMLDPQRKKTKQVIGKVTRVRLGMPTISPYLLGIEWKDAGQTYFGEADIDRVRIASM